MSFLPAPSRAFVTLGTLKTPPKPDYSSGNNDQDDLFVPRLRLNCDIVSIWCQNRVKAPPFLFFSPLPFPWRQMSDGNLTHVLSASLIALGFVRLDFVPLCHLSLSDLNMHMFLLLSFKT